ncbi:hypothetical protein MIR68_008230 [Amoeboaphelidium protococcarum]|nr:hypothetical protein MIR68_008230 [Amoeboaphelidium protococcarum]
MKITKSPPKRLSNPPQAFKTFIRKIVNSSGDPREWVSVIDKFLRCGGQSVEVSTLEWTYPKVDMYHFVSVLDCFDQFYSDMIKRYELGTVPLVSSSDNDDQNGALDTAGGFYRKDDKKIVATRDRLKVQLGLMEAADKQTLIAVLTMSRMLLENAMNRGVYNSYDNLNCLLGVNDLDVLECVLKLLVRPAQRSVSVRPFKTQGVVVHVSTAALRSLSLAWQSNSSLKDVCNPEHKVKDADMIFSFYRSQAQQQQQQASSGAEENMVDIGGGASSGNGFVKFNVPYADNVMEHFNSLVQKYKVPQEMHVQLLHSLRFVNGMQTYQTRLQLLRIRLLAMALYTFMSQEVIANVELFDRCSFVMQDVAGLLDSAQQSNFSVPSSIQAAALILFEAMCQHRGKVNDLMGVLNLGASHGILLFLLRKSIIDACNIGSDADKRLDFNFMDSLLCLISTLLANKDCGNQLVQAGIVPVVLSAFQHSLPKESLRVFTKLATILDTVSYASNVTGVFDAIADADGFNIIVRCIKQELDVCLDYEKAQASPAIEQESVHMMMVDDNNLQSSSSGTSPVSIGVGKKSPNVSSEKIPYNRISLFKSLVRFIIHTMQSQGGNDRIRNLVESPLPDIILSVMKNVNAFGAVITAMAYNLFGSMIHNEPAAFAVLQDKGVVDQFIGVLNSEYPASFDLLFSIPYTLGAICLNSSALDKVHAMNPFPNFFSTFMSSEHIRPLLDEDASSALGTSFDELVRHHPRLKDDILKSFKDILLKVAALGRTSGVDVVGRDPIKSGHQLLTYEAEANVGAIEFVDEDVATKDETHESPIMCFVDICARFAEGFFQTESHAGDFMKMGGVEALLDLYSLPSLPYDFGSSLASFSCSSVLRVMSGIDIRQVLTCLLEKTSAAFQGCQQLFNCTDQKSIFAKYIDLISGSNLLHVEQGRENFRAMASVHAHVGALCDVFSSPMMLQATSAFDMVSCFSSDAGLFVLRQVFELYKFCALEIQFFRKEVPKELAGVQVDADGKVPQKKEDRRYPNPQDIRVRNVKALRYLLSQTTAFIVPLLQGLSKILLPPKRMKAEQRPLAVTISELFVEQCLAMLKWERVPATKDVVRYHYLQICTGFLQTLITDERSVDMLQTITAVSFVNHGGLALFLDLFGKTLEEYLDLSKDVAVMNDKEQKLGIQKCEGLLNNLLMVFQLFCASKSIHDSKHTQYFLGKNRELGAPVIEVDFSPHQFLVNCRLMCITKLSPIMKALDFSQIKPNTQRLFMNVFTNIFDADRESNAQFSEISKIVEEIRQIVPGATVVRNLDVSEADIERLMNLGFSRRRCLSVLQQYGNNVEEAYNHLISLNLHVDAGGSYRQAPANTDDMPALVDVPAQGSSNDGLSQNIDDAMDEDAISDDGDNDYEDVDSDDDQMSEDEEDKSQGEEEKTELTQKQIESAQQLKDLKEARDELRDFISTHMKEFISRIGHGFSGFKNLILKVYAKKQDLLVNVFNDCVISSLNLDNLENADQLKSAQNKLSFAAVLVQSFQQKSSEENTAVSILTSAAEFIHRLQQAKDVDSVLSRNLICCILAIVEYLVKPFFQIVKETVTDLTNYDDSYQPNVVVQVQLSEKVKDLIVKLCSVVNTLLNEDQIMNGDLLVQVVRFLVLSSRVDGVIQLLLTAANNDGKSALEVILERSQQLHVRGLSALVCVLVRHIVESPDMLRLCFASDINTWLNTPRQRTTDVSLFVKNFAAAIIRHPQSFVDAAKDQCKLTQYSKNGIFVQIQSINAVFKASDSIQEDQQNVEEKKFDCVGETMQCLNSSDQLGGMNAVISILVRNILAFDAKTAKDRDSIKEVDRFNLSLNLQMLSEIWTSFPCTRLAMFKGGDLLGSLGQFEKFVQLLMRRLIPYPNLNYHAKSNLSKADKTLLNVSLWSMHAVVALCSVDEVQSQSPAGGLTQKSGRSTPVLNSIQDLAGLRKFVLDQLARCMKFSLYKQNDVNSKYGALLAYCDLLQKIISPKLGQTAARSNNMQLSQAGTEPVVIRAVLERNFLQLLTSIFNGIDYGLPGVDNFVDAVLRPLESLTRSGNKISKFSSAANSPKASRLSLLDAIVQQQKDQPEYQGSQSASLQLDNDEFISDSALGVMNPAGVSHGRNGMTSSDEDGEEDQYGEEEDYYSDEDMMDEDAGGDFTDVSDETDDDHSMNSGDDMDMEVVIRATPVDDEDDDSLDDDDDDGDISDTDSDLDDYEMEHDGDSVHNHDYLEGEEYDDEDEDAPEWLDIADDEDGDGPGHNHGDPLAFEVPIEDLNIVRPPNAGGDQDAGGQRDFQLDFMNHFDDDDLFAAVEHAHDDDQDVDDYDDDEDPEEDEDEEDYENQAWADYEIEMGNDDFVQMGGRPFGGMPPFGNLMRRRIPPLNTIFRPDAFDEIANSGFQVRMTGGGIQQPLMMDDGIASYSNINGRTNAVSLADTIPQNPDFLSNGGQSADVNPDGLTLPRGLVGSRPDLPEEAQGAIQMIEQLLHVDPRSINVTVENGRRSFNARQVDGLADDQTQQKKEDSFSNEFLPTKSSDRWFQEAKFLFGAKYSDQAQNVVNHVLNALLPAAKVADKLKAEEQKRLAEVKQREREEKEAKEAADRAAEQQKRAQEAAEAAANSEQSGSAQSTQEGSQPSSSQGPTNENVITIYGTPVDLTSTGIDVMFLQALPDDLRVEVIGQYLREQTTNNIITGDISEEFLQQLPIDVRRMIRAQGTDGGAGNASAALGALMDTDAPTLSQMEQSMAEFLNHLPPEMQDFLQFTEGNIAQHRNHLQEEQQNQQRQRVKAAEAVKKLPVNNKEPAQILDLSSLLDLLKIAFAPRPIHHHFLPQLLRNLCENSVARKEIINAIIFITARCAREWRLGANEPESLKQQSTTLDKGGKGKERMSQQQQQESADPLLDIIMPLDLSYTSQQKYFEAVQRCIGLLLDLAIGNEQIAKYFLVENKLNSASVEMCLSPSQASSPHHKKDKSGSQKEHRRKSSAHLLFKGARYPLFVLLEWFEQPVFVQNTNLMEQLSQLVAVVTRPLGNAAQGTGSNNLDSNNNVASSVGGSGSDNLAQLIQRGEIGDTVPLI